MSMEFDPCLNVAAAPDDLFTGMITDVFKACFMALGSDKRRKEVEVEINLLLQLCVNDGTAETPGRKGGGVHARCQVA